MIKILDNHNCCGCEACVQVCPKHCIAFNEDEEGFLYPKVDEDICIRCGLCEKVCPFLNQNESKKPIQAFAAINQNEDIRAKSSSGGIFTAIAQKVIGDGGVVFGAKFNHHWEVEHGYTDTIGGVEAFRGSKYVQSRIGETYILAERYLKDGRIVLFSGTSCQISGLKHFLHKPYGNLITIDVVCHGVPSPKLWREYLSVVAPLEEITSISMKDKARGWRGYSITIKGEGRIISEKSSANKYMIAFSQNLSLRPSCYNCPAKSGKSGSDITLADYWGIEKFFPNMDDNKGTSFVCANTERGLVLLNSLDIRMNAADYTASVPYNSCIEFSTTEPINRKAFWQGYQERGIDVLRSLNQPQANIFKRIVKLIIKRF